ncbi:hypothetical protein CY35_10G075000 [Sphagnum magellanicum]|nr:hypothetical protein CY35_10G075000 [Sphagnum magellanicum]
MHGRQTNAENRPLSKGGERDFGSHLHPKVYAASARDLSKEDEGQHRLQIDGVNMTAKIFKDSVRQGKRPNLPPDFPARLSGLINRCWHVDPLVRPSFPDICTELRYIKGLLLTDDKSTLAKPPNEGFQGMKREGRFGGLGGERFMGCGSPMSIRVFA